MFYVNVIGVMAGSGLAGAAAVVLVRGGSESWVADITLLSGGLLALILNLAGVVYNRYR